MYIEAYGDWLCDRFKPSADLLVNPFFTSPLIARALLIGFSVIKGRHIEVKGLFTSLNNIAIFSGLTFMAFIHVIDVGFQGWLNQVLRPGTFMQNFVNYLGRTIKTQNAFIFQQEMGRSVSWMLEILQQYLYKHWRITINI
jgi:hypothetical protein